MHRFVIYFGLLLGGLCLMQPVLREAAPGPGRVYTTIERLAPARLRALSDARSGFRKARKPVRLETGYRDYRAILHAHAEDAAHTGGTRPELLAAAKETGVNIVMLTDHVRPPRDFIDGSWRGIRDGVLFIPGAESEGFLAYPAKSIIKAHLDRKKIPREEYIELVRRDGGNIFLSHVEERFDWPTDKLDGLEIYNNHTDFKDEGEFISWLRGSLTNSSRLKQIQGILADYPVEVFSASQDYLGAIIAKWDKDLQSHRLTGVAANDCHHNQVYTVRAAAPDAIEISIIGDPPRRVTVEQSPGIAEMLAGRKEGELIAKLDFDPYQSSLTYVTTHILAGELSEEAVRLALKASRAYVSHDWLCDPTGFAFIVERNGRRAGVMGDQLKLEDGMSLRLALPLPGTIRLFRNGKTIREVKSESMNITLKETGVYRVEVWLEADGESRPWIYSNAIRITD